MKKHNGMRPQDILILLAISIEESNGVWQNKTISELTELSPAEVSDSINRSMQAGLLDNNKKLMKKSFLDFILYGVKYVFPAIHNGFARGIPTACYASPLKQKILTNSKTNLVWAYKEGKVQGLSLEPLYRTVPHVALKSKELYKALSLIDAIRVSTAREFLIAKDEIKKWFKL